MAVIYPPANSGYTVEVWVAVLDEGYIPSHWDSSGLLYGNCCYDSYDLPPPPQVQSYKRSTWAFPGVPRLSPGSVVRLGAHVFGAGWCPEPALSASRGFRVFGLKRASAPIDATAAGAASNLTQASVLWRPTDTASDVSLIQYRESPNVADLIRDIQSDPAWHDGDPVAFTLYPTEAVWPYATPEIAGVNRPADMEGLDLGGSLDRYWIAARDISETEWQQTFSSTLAKNPYLPTPQRFPRLLLDLTASAGPVSGGAATLSGDRRSGSTITVTGPAFIGTVSYPTDTTWEVTVSGITATQTFTASDGTDSVQVTVNVAIVLDAPAASLALIASAPSLARLLSSPAASLALQGAAPSAQFIQNLVTLFPPAADMLLRGTPPAAVIQAATRWATLGGTFRLADGREVPFRVAI